MNAGVEGTLIRQHPGAGIAPVDLICSSIVKAIERHLADKEEQSSSLKSSFMVRILLLLLPPVKNKNPRKGGSLFLMAESEGFEPSIPLRG